MSFETPITYFFDNEFLNKNEKYHVFSRLISNEFSLSCLW